MSIDLTARVDVKIPGIPAIRSKDRSDANKFWAKTVDSVSANASTGNDWSGDWVTRGSTVDLPVGTLIVDCDVVKGAYDVALRVVLPNGKLRIVGGSTSKAWAQEMRKLAREWLAMPVRDRIVTAAKDYIADQEILPEAERDAAAIAIRRAWLADLESESRADPKADAVAKIKALMAEHGITPDDLR